MSRSENSLATYSPLDLRPRPGSATLADVTWASISHALIVPRQRTLDARRKFTIYALTDSRDLGIRYIGVTSRKLNERLALHFAKPTNPRMRAWLIGSRRFIRIIALEEVAFSEWEDAERGWVFWCRERGQLLNVDRGGAARTSRGELRPFKAGAYQEPTRHPGRAETRLERKVTASQDAHESPGGGADGRGSSPRFRPRLVPVAAGVFRRTRS